MCLHTYICFYMIMLHTRSIYILVRLQIEANPIKKFNIPQFNFRRAGFSRVLLARSL